MPVGAPEEKPGNFRLAHRTKSTVATRRHERGLDETWPEMHRPPLALAGADHRIALSARAQRAEQERMRRALERIRAHFFKDTD